MQKPPAQLPAANPASGALSPPTTGSPAAGAAIAPRPVGAVAARSRDAFAEAEYRGSGSDFDFMRDMQQAMVNDRSRSSFLLLVLVVGLLASAAVWASYSRLEEITRGDAKVIPSSREQVIQSLEGGILAEMMVREGDIVTPGQSLLRVVEEI